MMRRAAVSTLLLTLCGAGAAAQDSRTVPYWASLAAGDALMRSGPGREYPAVWRYRRADLPVRVVAVHTSWRKLRDVDGTEGWMASVLLSDRRTGMVRGADRPLRASPDSAAKVLWRVAPGVVGRISHCGAGWCEFDAHGRVGYIEAVSLWGVEPGEIVE